MCNSGISFTAHVYINKPLKSIMLVSRKDSRKIEEEEATEVMLHR